MKIFKIDATQRRMNKHASIVNKLIVFIYVK